MANNELTILEVNAETGEEIIRSFTDTELEQREIDQKNAAATQAEADALAKARTSALAKLKKLGLTDKEIAAL